MAASVFEDKDTRPDDKMLVGVLGKSNRLWQEIKKHLAAEYGELIEEWKFYGRKAGWVLKTLRKKRNLFFFIPLEDSFQVSFVFGEKAVAAVEKSDLPHKWFIWENRDGKAATWVQHEILSGKRCHEAKAADVDGDGDIDICTKPWNGDEHVYLRNMLKENSSK